MLSKHCRKMYVFGGKFFQDFFMFSYDFRENRAKKISGLSQAVFKDLCKFSVKITWAHHAWGFTRNEHRVIK